MHTSLTFPRSGVAALALAALVVAGCGGADGASEARDENGTPAQRSVRVETLLLQPTDFEDVVELTGTVEALDDARLSAQASGTVEYLAALGQRVGRGAAVARLDQGLVRAAVQQAEALVESAQAQFELAEDNLQRNEPLYQDSIISAIEFQSVRAQYNQARAGLRQAQAGLAQAREQFSNTVVTAPFGGVVEAHFVERGEQVAPGMAVARVVSTGRVRVNAGVPERYAADIEMGTPVLLDFKAYSGGPERGRVTFVGSAIDPQSRTFPVEIEIPNPDGTLKPEMIVEVFITRSQLANVLVIPRSAVLRDETGNSVFVAAERDGRPVAERRYVTLGPSYSGRVLVESGLETGDRVLVLGQTNVTEGDAVEVVEQYRSIDAAGVPLNE